MQKKAKMALITGASAGIGEATALMLAQHGYHLVLIARREERLKKLAEKIKKQFEIDVHILIGDVQKKSQVEALAEKHKELLKQVDVLVNNAGLAKGLELLQDAKLEDCDIMIDTNVKGLLYWTRMVLPFMIEKNSGHIINLGSVAGRWVYPSGAVYCATKFAVRALSEGMRMDLKGTAIRVTNIEPGMVETDFSLVRLNDPARAKATYAGTNALKAEDIAECVLWSLQRPPHVNIQELVVFPTDQSAISIVNRK